MKNINGWEEFNAAIETSHLPHAMIAIIPAEKQEKFVFEYARKILGTENGWSENCHPDLIQLGTADKPPSIEECRKLNELLSMHPVCAKYRLAVIWAAEALSLPAENSLLKITEEPPSTASLLFIAEEDTFLPTIKSRAWYIRYIEENNEESSAVKAPSLADEWVSWMQKTSSKKADINLIITDLKEWEKYYENNKEYTKALNIDTLIKIINNLDKRITVPIIQDAVFAIIQGDMTCEEIFSNLW